MTEWDKNIELRSDAVRDIIGKTPSWVIRWGTISVALVIVILIFGSAWFNYPDRLSSSITIMSSQPPVEIIARNDAYIEHLFVSDSQSVELGFVLAVLESSVDYKFVKQIEPELDSLSFWIENKQLSNLKQFTDSVRPQPGELKVYYSNLSGSIRSFLSFIELDKYAEKTKSVKHEIKDTHIHFDRLYKQRQLKKEELKLAKVQLDRQKSLLESGTISKADFESASQKYLSLNFEFEETRSGLSSYQIQLDKLESEILEYKILDTEERQNLINQVQSYLTDIKGAISEWEINYLLVSPVDGTVILTNYWAENQSLKAGDRVLTIIQSNSQELIGRLALPVAGSGKAKIGQKVLVRVNRFPYMEYGMLLGYIKNISLVSDQEYFSVEVDFPEGLLTSYGTELKLSQGMSGDAEIITENMSFLARIINPIRYLLNKNSQVD